MMVLGEFGRPPDSGELDLLKKEKFSALIPPNIFTNISTKSPQGSSCLDNIWLSRSLKKAYTGLCKCTVSDKPGLGRTETLNT